MGKIFKFMLYGEVEYILGGGDTDYFSRDSIRQLIIMKCL
jgi:hypothetical protein